MDRGAWQAAVHGAERVGHDLTTKPLIVQLFTHQDRVGTSSSLHVELETGSSTDFFFFFNAKHRNEGKSHLGQKGRERLGRNVI